MSLMKFRKELYSKVSLIKAAYNFTDQAYVHLDADKEYNLNAIVNTTYHKHYQFVKNAFAFYVLSCRIYNTPVLTNLLHSKTTENDVEQLKNERKLLDAQTDSLCKTMAVERKGEQR